MKNRSAYWRDYYLAHKDKKKEYDQRRYLGQKQQKVEHQRVYHAAHKEERKVYETQYLLNLKRQFMDGVYGGRCYFCKQMVVPEDLARHHINGDGNEDRERLGGGTTGKARSWKKAIAEQNPEKWATSHRSCHSRFHSNEMKP